MSMIKSGSRSLLRHILNSCQCWLSLKTEGSSLHHLRIKSSIACLLILPTERAPLLKTCTGRQDSLSSYFRTVN